MLELAVIHALGWCWLLKSQKGHNRASKCVFFIIMTETQSFNTYILLPPFFPYLRPLIATEPGNNNGSSQWKTVFLGDGDQKVPLQLENL